jgi:hypothetical protein
VRRQLLVLVLRLHQLLLRLALLLQQLLLRLVTLQMPRLRLLPGMGREMAMRIWMLQLQTGEYSMAHACLINLATRGTHDLVNV